ncbi:hypothetical protein KDI_20600 [Dictyobacter arantiisoli]|uniref:Uncharacterized protein n=1 Tax=Dictyobacter arantiisoli TaxID=2014874 RepID=A0A5A5TBG0_9CHLR|nr:hypothetical protein KDI_20600 [Dictyobacter arantiisoli]
MDLKRKSASENPLLFADKNRFSKKLDHNAKIAYNKREHVALRSQNKGLAQSQWHMCQKKY